MTYKADGPSLHQDSPQRAGVDGRRLRSARTRQLVIEAYLSLVRENPKIPTANQIAGRAGYSVRSVFERFADLHALRIAAIDHAFGQAVHETLATHPAGDRQTRLAIHVRRRAQVCEQWLPLWRALNANKGESKELEERIGLIRRMIVGWLGQVYSPELSSLSEESKARTVLAIEALIDFESWGRMREFHALSFEESCAVWGQAIDRLLPPTPPNS